MTEGDLQREIMKAVTARGARCFRNNVAEGWIGNSEIIEFGPIVVKTSNARRLHAGLCVGSSDLIGWTKDGRFLAIEVKTKTGRVTPEQQNFINQVNAAGGVGIVARSVQDALNALDIPTP